MSAPRFFSQACGICWLGLACTLPAWVWGCSAKGNGKVDPPSARCASCHLPEFQSTTHPPHPGVRPTTCGVCHGETGWHPARSPFLHSFPLAGGHAKPACFACHTGATPQFEGTARECVACHQRDQGAANAKVARHDTFPGTCDTCHTINAWKPTLPHDAAFTEPLSEPESTPVPPSVSAPGSAHATSKKPPASTTRPSTAPKKTWTPDQVSGASRVK